MISMCKHVSLFSIAGEHTPNIRMRLLPVYKLYIEMDRIWNNNFIRF